MGLVADDGSGDPAGTRFRRHRAVASLVSAVADRGPVLLVLDDLHRADGDTLDLLTALLTGPQPATGPVLILGTYRATEISPELTAALARAAGLEPIREYLAGLPVSATDELARAVVGAALDPATARLIHDRSGGNPFFVRELAQLYASEGEAALAAVPPGVRDVIRHRLAQLPTPTRTVLRQAAVLGRDLDPEVLGALAGDPTAVLDAVDRALQAGFLTEREPDGRLRFTHILVRDTLYADLSTPRRAAWHAAVAEVLRQREPVEPAALAHHLLRAGGPVAAGRAAAYARTAAEQAERGGNPHEAARLWGQTIEAYDRAGAGEQRERLTALLGLGRALAVTGRLAEARRRRAEAITAAESVGDPLLIEEVLAGFDVPAIWTRNDDDLLSGHIVRAAEHALTALGPTGSARRSRLLSTLALELRGTTTDRGRRAAHEAETIARTVGDPGLLAFALNARFMHSFDSVGLAADTGPDRRRTGRPGGPAPAGDLRGARSPRPGPGTLRAGRPARCRRARPRRRPPRRTVRTAAGRRLHPLVRGTAPGSGRRPGRGGGRVPVGCRPAERRRHAGSDPRVAPARPARPAARRGRRR